MPEDAQIDAARAAVCVACFALYAWVQLVQQNEGRDVYRQVARQTVDVPRQGSLPLISIRGLPAGTAAKLG